jgi:hypothetical protein
MDLPYPDETWASFLDRAAQRYLCSRKDLLVQLVPYIDRDGWPDLDTSPSFGPLARVVGALVDALGVSSADLPTESRGVTRNSLPPRSRVDYCPLCFLEDLAKRRTPYFRFQWAIPYLPCCHRHETPLLRWRSVRYRSDERNLPLNWVLRPRIKYADNCSWLDEDAAYASRFAESKVSRDHPIRLVQRLGKSVVQFSADPLSWREVSPFFGFNLESLICLGASSTPRGKPNAELLRPASGGERLFGPPRASYRWQTRAMYKVWLGKPMDIAYRRSLLWFAARTIFGSSCRTCLFDGFIAPSGGWESWWLGVVKPLVPRHFAARIDREAEAMKKGDNWRARQLLK